jgi:Phage tail tube protein
MPIMEPNYYGLWIGKQTAKGTPNTAPSKRLIQVGGDFNIPRSDGQENYSDLTPFGNRTDWVNNVLGQGEPAIEATPTELAYLLWLANGGETVTAVTGPPTAQKHSFTPNTNRPHWCTVFRRVGLNVLQRQQFNDCLITRVQIEGSTANKACRITPRIISLDPGEIKTADPAAVMPTDKPFLYTDGVGAFTIDSVVFPGQSQFTIVVDNALEPVYGDDTVPNELVQGTPSVTIALTCLMDANALAQYNKMVYGTAAPTAGTKPLKGLPALGQYSAYLKQRDSAGALNGREFHPVFPANSIKWTPPDAPGPNPDGGATEIALAGELRGGTYTIDVNTANGDVAFTT